VKLRNPVAALLARVRTLARDRRPVRWSELELIEAAVVGGGPIADRIVRQFRQAPHAWRRTDADQFHLTISTFDALTIQDAPRGGWTSSRIPVTTIDSRRLTVEVRVLEMGICDLRGWTADRLPWPAPWAATPESLAEIERRAPWIELPTPAELQARREVAANTARAWLEISDETSLRAGGVWADSPASDEAIAALEARERFPLPDSYRQLLVLADGIQVGSKVVLGSRDAYRLDIPGPDRLVISPPNEDGVFTLAPTGEVVFVSIDGATSDGDVVASDLRAWISTRLSRRSPR
jgi:hypothetical protein